MRVVVLSFIFVVDLFAISSGWGSSWSWGWGSSSVSVGVSGTQYPYINYWFDEEEFISDKIEGQDGEYALLDNPSKLYPDPSSGKVGGSAYFDKGHAYSYDANDNLEMELGMEYTVMFWYAPQFQTGNYNKEILNIQAYKKNGRSWAYKDFLMFQPKKQGSNADVQIKIDMKSNEFTKDILQDIPDNEWHHIAVTMDISCVCNFAVDYKVYVDGELFDDAHIEDDTLRINNTYYKIKLGRSPLQFHMDEFKVFQEVLDSTTISEIYTNENAGLNYDGSVRGVGGGNEEVSSDFNATMDSNAKIVNGEFDITYHNLKGGVQNVNVRLVATDSATCDVNSPNVLYDWHAVNFNGVDPTKTISNYKIDSAHKYVWTLVQDDDVKCMGQRFSIRPKNFSVTLSETNFDTEDNVTLTIQAHDANNNPAANYNESLSDINITIANGSPNPSCNDSGFIGGLSGSFVNGSFSQVVRAEDIGSYLISVSERSDNRFAKDDQTVLETQRSITPTTAMYTVHPKMLGIVTQQTGVLDPETLYHSSEDSFYMGSMKDANLTTKFIVRAMNSDEGALSNFDGACLAEDMSVVLDYDLNGSAALESICFVEGSERACRLEGDNQLSIDINSTDFTQGDAMVTVYNNIQRPNTAINPLATSLTRVSADATFATTSTPVSSGLKKFYYGRVYAPDIRVDTNPAYSTVYYEVYCNGCDKGTFDLTGADHNNSDQWFSKEDILANYDCNLQTSFKITPDVKADGKTIELQYNGPFPYRERITIIDTKEYFRYGTSAEHNSTFSVEYFDPVTATPTVTDDSVLDGVSNKPVKRIEW
jgi:hypothetical protein